MRRRPSAVGAVVALSLLAPAVATVERGTPADAPPGATARLDANLLDANLLDDPIEVAGPTLETRSAIRASRPAPANDGEAVGGSGGASHRVSH